MLNRAANHLSRQSLSRSLLHAMMPTALNATAGPSSLRSLRPPRQEGMRTLDRSAFDVDVPILAVKVAAGKISSLRAHPELRGLLLDLPKTRSVVSLPGDEDHRVLRLKLTTPARDLLKSEGAGLLSDSIKLDYDHWTASEILNAVLPASEVEEIPSSFTLTGHIGHVNLRDEWLPYKHLIGQVILDKNKNLRTVVNKLNNIHAEYRYFDMEVLAGDKDYITTVYKGGAHGQSESNCSFTFDFSLVYWNSRLHTEHSRLVSLMQPDEVIIDVMAGAGPFAIPAAKKGCAVWGNDLNPEGVKWMEVNRVKNKVEKTLRVSCADGREFIRTAPLRAWLEPFPPYKPPRTAREAREERHRRQEQAALKKASPESSSQSSRPGVIPPDAPQHGHDATMPTTTTAAASASSASAPNPTPLLPRLPSHYIMNLPDSAITFLDAFTASYTPLLTEPTFLARYPRLESKGNGVALETVPMPMVHVYGFTREMEYPGAERDICERATLHLGHPITPDTPDFNLHLVRSVAPNKEMYCLSFRLPLEVAFKGAI